MKHLKTYKIFEQKDNSELIKQLNFYGIKNYTINNDETVDVNGDVYLSNMNLSKIPFKFGRVTERFQCYGNNLTSLNGCPKEVGGDFDCSHNKLKDLVGGPQEVTGTYFCSNNKLETLEGCAGDIGESLYCRSNNLTSLDCSSVINGNIFCRFNNFTEEPEFFGVCGGKIYYK